MSRLLSRHRTNTTMTIPPKKKSDYHVTSKMSCREASSKQKTKWVSAQSCRRGVCAMSGTHVVDGDAGPETYICGCVGNWSILRKGAYYIRQLP